jgi:hypothetical protein
MSRSSAPLVDFYARCLRWFVLVVLGNALVRFHRATSNKKDSLHFTDDEETGIQLRGKYRMARNHSGCSQVLGVAFWDRKFIMGTLQRIDGQAGCNTKSRVGRHGQYHPYLCASPYIHTFPVANVQVVGSLGGHPFNVHGLYVPTVTA